MAQIYSRLTGAILALLLIFVIMGPTLFAPAPERSDKLNFSLFLDKENFTYYVTNNGVSPANVIGFSIQARGEVGRDGYSTIYRSFPIGNEIILFPQLKTAVGKDTYRNASQGQQIKDGVVSLNFFDKEGRLVAHSMV